MPYSTGMILVIVGVLVAFATFFWLVVNARALMMLFRGGRSDVVAGPGNPRKSASPGTALAMLLLHFAAWGLVALAYFWMLADSRAVAPDVTPLEPLANTSR